MRCDNLIPGIVAACRWGVESGKLVYSGTFGHVQHETLALLSGLW